MKYKIKSGCTPIYVHSPKENNWILLCMSMAMTFIGCIFCDDGKECIMLGMGMGCFIFGFGAILTRWENMHFLMINKDLLEEDLNKK